MLRCAPRRRATAPAPASPPRHYRAARRRRAPPPRAATARRPTALRAPPPPTPPPCWHTPTASRAPPHRDTTATAPPRRLAAASGGRRACREGRAAGLRARGAQASSCSGFLTDETGSTGEATSGVAGLLPFANATLCGRPRPDSGDLRDGGQVSPEQDAYGLHYSIGDTSETTRRPSARTGCASVATEVQASSGAWHRLCAPGFRAAGGLGEGALVRAVFYQDS